MLSSYTMLPKQGPYESTLTAVVSPVTLALQIALEAHERTNTASKYIIFTDNRAAI